MGLREWVIVLAVIFMVVLAVDAWRRVRRQRHYHGDYVTPSARTSNGNDSLKVSRVVGHRAPVTQPSVTRPNPAPTEPESASDAESEEHLSWNDAELPADEPEPEPELSVTETPAPTAVPSSYQYQSAPRHRRLPPANLREKVPMLLDSLEEEAFDPEAESAAEDQFEFDLKPPSDPSGPQDFAADKGLADALQEDEPNAEDVLLSRRSGRAPDFATEFSAAVRTHQTEVQAPMDWAAEAESAPEVQDVSPYAHLERTDKAPSAAAEEPDAAADEGSAKLSADPAFDPSAGTYDEEAGDQLLSEPEQVLVISVLARKGEEFEGSTLLQIMLACGMRFGNMSIFHATDNDGRLQYSAANAYNPGTFDLDNIEHFTTRGVTFFLQLPCQCKAMEAFEAMYHTASTLATHMNGEILDETRSVMTTQTLTHYQERIRDYQRAQLVKRA